MQLKAASSPRSKLRVRTTVRKYGFVEGSTANRWTSIAGLMSAERRWPVGIHLLADFFRNPKRSEVGEKIQTAELVEVDERPGVTDDLGSGVSRSHEDPIPRLRG